MQIKRCDNNMLGKGSAQSCEKLTWENTIVAASGGMTCLSSWIHEGHTEVAAVIRI